MKAKTFEGQVVILTGAAGGIGKAIAKKMFQSGARIAIADYDAVKLTQLAKCLDPDGERVIPISYDARRFTDAETVVSTCIAHFGYIDHVIPAAGIYEEIPIETMTDEQWRKTMSINLDGVFYICQRSIPHIRSGGTIVTIASGAAHQGCAPGAQYAASKGAILAFSRSLAKELAPKVRVNSVSPGVIDTSMVSDLLNTRRSQLLPLTPAGRFGSAEDVANVVAFLCSEASAYITGEAIHVNGGFYMGA